jgi:sortase A
MKSKQSEIWKIFVIIGMLLLLAATGLVGYNWWDGKRAEDASNEVLSKLQPMIDRTIEENKGDNRKIGDFYPERNMPVFEIDGYQYIGILEIPDLGYSLPIMDRWDYTRLKISLCLYAGTVYKDNMVIAGHNYARHFSPVKWLPEGSAINFTDADGVEYPYKIAWIETLDPTQVSEMVNKKKGSDWDLTLFTCNTGGQTRCAIRCVRTDKNR